MFEGRNATIAKQNNPDYVICATAGRIEFVVATVGEELAPD